MNLQGNIADWNVNQDLKTPVVMMKGINYIGNSIEYPEAGVHLNLPLKVIELMNWNDTGVRTAEKCQKAKVGLQHPEDSL